MVFLLSDDTKSGLGERNCMMFTLLASSASENSNHMTATNCIVVRASNGQTLQTTRAQPTLIPRKNEAPVGKLMTAGVSRNV